MISSLPSSHLSLGASVTSSGVGYTVWCPSQAVLKVEIQSPGAGLRIHLMERDGEGYHYAHDPQGCAGDQYAYLFSDGRRYPDPASRSQVTDVRGDSLVVNPSDYPWSDQGWVRPPFRDLVIYEIHIGTFSREGTFRAAIPHLLHLKDLGVRAIEIMPVADFPGERNWGYDGVLIYAPARCYGQPDDLRALVDAAHALGIAVILDVVYNHLGPDGNCLEAFAPQYFAQHRQTPWGASLNFDGEGSAHVRRYFASNAAYWMDEFHMDGLRLDATHWILDPTRPHLISEIAELVHLRGGYVIAEDERNEVRLVESVARGGYGCDAVWADDYHHSVRVGQTGERHSYLQDFNGSLEETVDALKHGWLFRGQKRALHGAVPRGTEVAHVPPSKLIHCISNHDQTGNRAFGDRLHQIIPSSSYRAISMLLCFTPYVPMLFMGQEWACSTPFQFFTNHSDCLGQLVTEGRRREFIAFPEFNDPANLHKIPDPQSSSTFLNSKLNWDDLDRPIHQEILRLYQACLELRMSDAVFRPASRSGWQVQALTSGVGCIKWSASEHEYLLLFHLWPSPNPVEVHLNELPWDRPSTGQWELLITSNGREFGGPGTSLPDEPPLYLFGEAETLLLRKQG